MISKEQQVKFYEMGTWKKRNRIPTDKKIFIIKGAYDDIREALLSRGWIENPDFDSPCFDFLFCVKTSDVNYESLERHQKVNHFNFPGPLSSKSGLCKNIRNMIWEEKIDVDEFYPRCYDLRDFSEFHNFIEDFKFSKALSILNVFLKEPQKFQKSKLLIDTVFNVCLMRVKSVQSFMDETFNKKIPFVNFTQWKIMNSKEDSVEITELDKYVEKAISVKSELMKFDPQNTLCGDLNIWICKPGGLSRGRGIKCFDSLELILDHVLSKSSTSGFVVQKYIENSLIIKSRKFDIRAWAVIIDYTPLKIYFYDEIYIRFGAETYDIKDFGNKFAHLTNNSIGKYSEKFHESEIKGNMWEMNQFSDFIKNISGEDKFEKCILPKIKKICEVAIKSTKGLVAGRKGSFELLGFDFMVDEFFNPWLLEVNTSPAMDYSTEITKRMVKEMSEDLIKLVVDIPMKKRKVGDHGKFTLIYSD